MPMRAKEYSDFRSHVNPSQTDSSTAVLSSKSVRSSHQRPPSGAQNSAVVFSTTFYQSASACTISSPGRAAPVAKGLYSRFLRYASHSTSCVDSGRACPGRSTKLCNSYLAVVDEFGQRQVRIGYDWISAILYSMVILVAEVRRYFGGEAG